MVIAIYVFVEQGNGTYDNYYAQSAGHCDRVPFPQSITLMKKQQFFEKLVVPYRLVVLLSGSRVE